MLRTGLGEVPSDASKRAAKYAQYCIKRGRSSLKNVLGFARIMTSPASYQNAGERDPPSDSGVVGAVLVEVVPEVPPTFSGSDWLPRTFEDSFPLTAADARLV